MTTHIDAPAHVVQGTPFIDEVPLPHFFGSGIVVSIPKKKWEQITADDLEKACGKAIRPGDVLIINTGWHKVYEDGDYFAYCPGLVPSAADWMIEKNIKVVGHDTQANDHPLATAIGPQRNGPLLPHLAEEYKEWSSGIDWKDAFPEWEPVLQGAYFSIGTWVAAEVVRLVFAQVGALGGGSGISLPAGIVTSIAGSREIRETSIYWVALALAIGTVVFVVAVLRSRFGLALTAIRDSEIASESLGISIRRTKLFVYVVVAGMTAMVGAFIFLQKLRISPDAGFSVNDWTAYVIFIAVIGGLGTIEGPIIGTIVFFLLRETLSELGTIYLMILGAVAIAVMLKAPKGLWGTFSEKTGIVLIPVRRRILLSDEPETRK